MSRQDQRIARQAAADATAAQIVTDAIARARARTAAHGAATREHAAAFHALTRAREQAARTGAPYDEDVYQQASRRYARAKAALDQARVA